MLQFGLALLFYFCLFCPSVPALLCIVISVLIFFNATQKSTTKEKDQIPTCAGDLRACGFKVIGLVGVNSIPGTRSNMRSYGNKRNERTNFKPEK